jgi:alcohol dehydrogenase class IV
MDAFRFAYDPATVVYGRECVAGLEEELAGLDCERALVVCGRTVGATAAVIDPVRAGLGERLAGVFAETTPKKDLATAHALAERVRADDIDCLVALGGGSSLDVATVARVLAAEERPYEAVLETFVERGTVPLPAAPLPALVSVPTTLAGAELSVGAGITAETETGFHRGGVGDARLMPNAVYYDPALFETTPDGVLCASAMNGFDKGVESLYARTATPVTDATAMRGLALLREGLPALGAGDRSEETLYRSLVGTMLVQYGASRGEGTTLSLVHAFGHGLRPYSIQQGDTHGVLAPHALGLLFSHVDSRRELLAEALGVDTEGMSPEAVGEAVIEAVTEIRDALGLRTHVRTVEDLPREDLPAIAEVVAADAFMWNCPEGFDPTLAELEAVLEAAW